MTSPRFMELWYKYCKQAEFSHERGITNELTLLELRELSKLATHETGESFEIVICDYTEFYCENTIAYGYDVTGFGGYSLIGDGFFGDDPVWNPTWMTMEQRQFFKSSLNKYGLFPSKAVADKFQFLLTHTLSDEIEGEDWKSVFIAHLK